MAVSLARLLQQAIQNLLTSFEPYAKFGRTIRFRFGVYACLDVAGGGVGKCPPPLCPVMCRCLKWGISIDGLATNHRWPVSFMSRCESSAVTSQ